MEVMTEAPRRCGSRLRGFDSGACEIDGATLQVRGRLPPWLRGSLLLNGPALWDLPGGRMQHWFDGYAMLHRLALDSGGAQYRSRFIQSQSYREALTAAHPVAGEFGTPGTASLLQRVRGARITDNPAVVLSRHGQRWLAVSETPILTYFDPESLATQERLDLGPALSIHLMAAHGHTLADGSYLNVGVELGRRCRYRAFRLPPGQARPEVLGEVVVPKSGYLHGVALARGQVIVCETALRAQALAFRFGAKAYKDNFRWEPGSGSALHALPLAGGAVRSWRIPPLMSFHATQAWDEGDDLLVDLSTFADATIFDELLLDRRRADAPIAQAPRLQRYRLRPGRSEAEVQDLGISMDLQQVHPDTVGQRRARVCWGMGGGERGRFLDHVLRLDLDSGAVARWQRRHACHLEPLFVARPGGSADDDGVLLVPTLADGDVASVIAVLDAATMACLAEIDAPQVLPFGFHAAFHHDAS